MILAIDPGNSESAYALMDENIKPVEFGKVKNLEMLFICEGLIRKYDVELVIEMVASYGMAVGKDVFETVFWIGRFWQAFDGPKIKIYRKDVKMNICGTMKAKDTNIRQALIDRFAKHDLKNGKGTAKNPDWFHGFKSDIWSAYAVGVTYYDEYLKEVQT